MDNIEARFNLSFSNFNLDVNIKIPCQGVTAILGHSGSGKTTLLRCIAGLDYVKNGFLSYGGEVWQNEKFLLPTNKRPLGYVFQEAHLFPHLNVLENIGYGLKRTKTLNEVINLDQIIGLLGINGILTRRPEKLSGGEKQRVAIARALAVNPRLLLMDEPLASLDTKLKQEVLPYLQKLHNELKIPILYVTHSPQEVSQLADYLIVMKSGKVLANGPLSETFSKTGLPVYLGDEIGVIIEGIIGEIDTKWNLVRIDFDGGILWVPDNEQMILNQKVRTRIIARDVSIAKKEPEKCSIQNKLSGKIVQILNDQHKGKLLIYVSIGGSVFVSRLTRKASSELALTVDDHVWVQIKSVAIL
ncbi:MAG: molybdenum ABC transporter ATP-binding protein [Oligoflexia bacterium]|nr:molybdenum ABC transporter ATP-binding protein [Oligoflexia bacterium]MBF0364718.1 molybdenum ABC transporter ATP-binding protein [Oligoflexia bacterium]